MKESKTQIGFELSIFSPFIPFPLTLGHFSLNLDSSVTSWVYPTEFELMKAVLRLVESEYVLMVLITVSAKHVVTPTSSLLRGL